MRHAGDVDYAIEALRRVKKTLRGNAAMDENAAMDGNAAD
jgi:hypothetical protein